MARSIGRGDMKAGRPGWKWWQGMLGGMVLMLSPGTALLFAAVAAPTLLMMIADATPRRILSRTIAMFSVAGAIDPVRSFVSAGHDLNAALSTLAQPRALVFTWLCAASGWLINELFCLVAVSVTQLRTKARCKVLETQLESIRTEWELSPDPTASPAP